MKWNAVQDKMPKNGQSVLVIDGVSGDMWLDSLHVMAPHTWVWSEEDDYITHWQSMPKPPKGCGYEK